jgi:hypothetical protein
MSDVNLSISQEVVKPIIEAQIKTAIAAALGKQDAIIKSAIEAIMNYQVDYQGKHSQYSSDNKYNFVEIHIQEAIQTALKEAIQEWVKENQKRIKEEFFGILKTRKGSSALVKAFIDGIAQSLDHSITINTVFKYD